MAVATTGLVEGGKIYSSNSAKESEPPTTLTHIYLGNMSILSSNVFFAYEINKCTANHLSQN